MSASTGIPRRLSLSVQYATTNTGLPDRQQIRRWLRAAIPGAAQVTVRFVDAEEGRALNAEYRGKDYATNVLSFPYETAPILLGDLVICWPVVVAEAKTQDKTAETHCAHLVIHGALHLQGQDHENDAAATKMEGEERKILAALGYPDPYANEKE